VFGNEIVPITVPLILGAGWNLISLPVYIRDSSRASLFPSPVSSAILYDNGSYRSAQMIRAGPGYWIRSASADTLLLTGPPVFTDTLDLQRGWNIVGGLTHDFDVSGIITDPPAILCNAKFFTLYQNTYYFTLTLQAGKAYWVKACGEGRLILGGGFLSGASRGR
jgi:hypothetical protein